MVGQGSRGCPCGTKSFRIHSIDPSGRVQVSPCVYAHDYRVGDLLKDDLSAILGSPQFEVFRTRRSNPETINECGGCKHLLLCRGGCTSRAYLWSQFTGGNIPAQHAKDPYCLRDFTGDTSCSVPTRTKQDVLLVHRDYLCTVIVDPS
jgi:radical SAM protein with 4Fe4S-binding SPASM domain